MKPPSASLDAAPAIPSSWSRRANGSSLLRRRSTGAFDALDPVLRIALGADQLHHGKLRNGEAVAARLDDQRRHDGERQRDLDAEARTRSCRGFDVDRAADLIDVGAHD